MYDTDVVTQYLPYTDFNNVYILPVFHMLLRGVLRDFWVEALGEVSLHLGSKELKDTIS